MFLIPILKNFRRLVCMQLLFAYYRVLSRLFQHYSRHPLRLMLWHRRRKITIVVPGIWFKYIGTIKRIIFYCCLIVLLFYAMIL